MSSPGRAAGGLVCAVIAGVAGSLFTVPTRKEKELGILAMQGSWEWSNIWLLFTIFNVLINTMLAEAIFGLDNVFQVYSEVSNQTQWAVILSSALWAFGTLLFGLGVDLSGVGLGVGLAMTSQIIFGTALPLIGGDDGAAVLASAEGALLLSGIALALLGFALMGRAGWLRDHHAAVSFTAPPSMEEEKALVKDEGSIQDERKSRGSEVNDVEAGRGGGKVASGSVTRRLWMGVLVSLFAGLFSALLQYAFVYGSEVVDRIQQPPYSASSLSASAIIWTVSTAVNNLVEVGYMIGLVTHQQAWGRYFEGGPKIFWPNVARCLLMSIFLNLHIELYGLSQALLGKLGPVVAWPLVMALVVLMSQVWGVLLNEWQYASRPAKLLNWGSISLIVSAVVLLGVAAAL